MTRVRGKKTPTRIAFRPKKVTMELTTKHTHRIFSIEKPMVKFTDLKENPDRILIGSTERGFVKAFAYKSNPERAFLSIGEEIFAIDSLNYPILVSLCTKIAWFLGAYGKRAKKYKIKFRNVGHRNLHSKDRKIRR